MMEFRWNLQIAMDITSHLRHNHQAMISKQDLETFMVAADQEEATEGHGVKLNPLELGIIVGFIAVAVISIVYCLLTYQQRRFDKAVSKARSKLTEANAANNTNEDPVHKFETYNRYFEVKYEELHRHLNSCCCVVPGPERSGIAKIHLRNNSDGYSIEGEYRNENTSANIIEGFVLYSGGAWWIEDETREGNVCKVLTSGKFDFSSDTFTGSRITNNGVRCQYTLFKGYEHGFENYFPETEPGVEPGPVEFDEALARARLKITEASKDHTKSSSTPNNFETYEGDFDVEYVDSGRKCSGLVKLRLLHSGASYQIGGEYTDENVRATIVDGCAAYSGDAWWIEEPLSGTFGGLKILTVGRFDFTSDSFSGTRVANSGASSPYISFKGKDVSKQISAGGALTLDEGIPEDDMKQPLLPK